MTTANLLFHIVSSSISFIGGYLIGRGIREIFGRGV